jgi:hypothetical protein
LCIYIFKLVHVHETIASQLNCYFMLCSSVLTPVPPSSVVPPVPLSCVVCNSCFVFVTHSSPTLHRTNRRPLPTCPLCFNYHVNVLHESYSSQITMIWSGSVGLHSMDTPTQHVHIAQYTHVSTNTAYIFAYKSEILRFKNVSPWDGMHTSRDRSRMCMCAWVYIRLSTIRKLHYWHARLSGLCIKSCWDTIDWNVFASMPIV